MTSSPATLPGTVTARRYEPRDAQAWDAFVADTATGNFLHTRRFLGYHGSRLRDCSLQFFDSAGRLCGVLPAAESPDDPRTVVSHPGATYGGLLHTQRKYGLDMFAMIEAARSHFLEAGYSQLVYKSVPSHLHRGPSETDLYALWRAGARLARRDLWNVIDLTRPRKVEEARRRRLRRARESGLRLVRDGSDHAYESFSAVLQECLAQRHAVAPVHSPDEMRQLQALFPEQIHLWLALDPDGKCVAGEWIFDCGNAFHGQYGAATEAGRECSAQDLLLEHIITDCQSRGVPFFSFGASTTAAGTRLNEGLFNYKASFGAGTITHDFYQLDLAHCEPHP